MGIRVGRYPFRKKAVNVCTVYTELSNLSHAPKTLFRSISSSSLMFLLSSTFSNQQYFSYFLIKLFIMVAVCFPVCACRYLMRWRSDGRSPWPWSTHSCRSWGRLRSQLRETQWRLRASFQSRAPRSDPKPSSAEISPLTIWRFIKVCETFFIIVKWTLFSSYYETWWLESYGVLMG